jgi:tRNA(Ile)-lysidine synthase
LNLLEAQSGKQIFSNTHRLLKDRNVLILSELSSRASSEAYKKLYIDEGIKQVELSIGRLTLESTKRISKSSESTIHIDKDLLKFPLILRRWEAGDYFYPFGMKGKKKLSKFFKDEKLSLLAKENIWVLCSENEVIWVVKHRLDDRYKVTGTTKNILKISIQE